MNESQINESVSDAMLVSWKEGALMIPCQWHYTVHILLHCSLLILLVGWGGGRMQ